MLRLTFLLLLSPLFLFAQNGNSPYSNIGMGEPIADEYIYNSGMGGLAAGVHTPFHINLNPAFLPHNRYTTFDLGLTGEYKKLTSRQNSVNDGNGNLRYLAFAFPVAKKYTISMGIKPLTSMSYNYSQQETIPGDTLSVQYTFKGEGGITSVFLSQGFQLTKGLGVGLKLAYNFGAVERKYDSYIIDNQLFILENNHHTNYRGLSITPAIGYTQRLKKGLFINAGAMYEFGNKWGYTDSKVIQKINSSGSIIDNGTVMDEVNGKVQHPSAFNIGLSIEREFKWLVGVEYKSQDWSKFKSVDNSETLKSVNTISVGGQYIPNLNAVRGYLNRVIYRLGVYYTQNQYTINSQERNDMGASLGFDFPVGRLSFLNLALSAGKRGDVKNNIVEENYYRINIGVTLNDRWFVRGKFD